MRHTRKQGGRFKNYPFVYMGVRLSLVLALLMTMGGSAAAANILVNSFADTQANDGRCTLREAIINANSDNQSGSTDCAAGSGPDVISFLAGGTISLGATLPAIGRPGAGSDITIDGAGAGITTISGAHAVRIFEVECNLPPVIEDQPCQLGGSLTLWNLVIKDGSSVSGGGVFNNGNVTISQSTFSGNSASAIDGGGAIYNSPIGRVLIRTTTFSSNSSVFDGSAITNEGVVNISFSTFASNTGGAVIANSVGLAPASLFIVNSTFSGNTGTVISTNSFARTFVSNSTLSGNGGAINNDGRTTIDNTIVANSARAQGNCLNLGTIIDNGNNIDDGTTCGFSAANNSKTNTNPLVDPAGLKDNGGLTLTLALCTGVDTPSAGCSGLSPAIDAGNNATCSDIDQALHYRPVDGDKNGTLVCDIGAVESGAVSLSFMNGLVSFVPKPSSYRTTSDTNGCPAGFVGQFSFVATLKDSSSFSLAKLTAVVNMLTNGNLLQNADLGPRGVGSILTVPLAGQYSDGTLSPNEFVDVPLIICLKTRSSFSFFVDVLGTAQ